MTDQLIVRMRVNGGEVTATVAPLTTLATLLRDRLDLKGTHLGCEEGVCGSCSVLVDGRSVRSCLTLAAQLQGASVTTVEGFAQKATLRAVQEAFVNHFSAQCGFCTAGMLAVVAEYLADKTIEDHSDETAICDRLNSVVCRCTGYRQIVMAVRALAVAKVFAANDV